MNFNRFVSEYLKKNRRKVVKKKARISIDERYERNYLNEGGNAVTASGDEAAKVNIIEFSEKQYEEFKKGIIAVVSEMSAAFDEKYGHPLFSQSALNSRDIFAGSCNYFFKKSKEEYTKYKPKMGDIDVQVNKDDIKEIKEFLNDSIGKTFAGWKYLGYQKVALVYCNVFSVPKSLRPQASNVQIDFNFVPYKNGAPQEFSVFAHNSEWEDLEQHIKGVAKNALLPIIYNVVYSTPGVLFTQKGMKLAKNQPEDIHTKSYGYNGSREKYQPVKDENGDDVFVNGKRAYREMPTSATPTNTNLGEIFKEMFGKIPSKDELKRLWSYIGTLSLMEKYLSKEQIQKIYTRYKKSLEDMVADEEVVKTILDKYKEKFPYINDTNEKFTLKNLLKQHFIG